MQSPDSGKSLLVQIRSTSQPLRLACDPSHERMRGRTAIAIIIPSVLLIAGLIAAVRTRVPTYKDKDVYQWMLEQRSSALESSPGFMAIGSNAVPFLARALAIDRTWYDRFAWVRSQRFQAMAKSHRLGFTWRMPSQEVRRKAAWSLLAFGFESRPALPQLHGELFRATDTDRQTVIHCLSELGPPPESIPLLVKAWPLTTNETYVVRHDLLHCLSHGPSNTPALAMPIAIAALSDPNPSVRSVAAQTLAQWRRGSMEAMSPLLHMLDETNDNNAMSAAMALGRITNRCESALPAVRRLLHSTNDYTRAVAWITLWRLGCDAQETRHGLELLLESKRAKGVAAKSLGEMGSQAGESIPALLRASQQAIGAWVDTYDRALCAFAVLRIQGASPEAYSVLAQAMTAERNSWVRETVAAATVGLGPLARPLIPTLRTALNDTNRDVRHEAMKALKELDR